MVDAVSLFANGQLYGGWTSVEVETGIDALASSFNVSLTERSPDDGTAADWLSRAGAPVSVHYGSDTVLTGWMDAAEIAIDGEAHGISIWGRSQAGDLVDCSAVNRPGVWTGKTMIQIATDLAAPFGISVTAEGDVGAPFSRFAIEPGETVHAALDRMARMRGRILLSQPDGHVVIAQPAPTGAVVRLTLGVNLLTIAATHDASQRFSMYQVTGQAAGNDEANGRAVAHVRAGATDAAITRYRPLRVVAEDQATLASAGQRGAWEASVRAARGQSVRVTVPGWRRSDGALWQPRHRVEIDAAPAFVRGELMVGTCRFILDENGERCELTLMHEAAYRPEPVPASAEAARVRR